jgi:hypothetical protein
MKHPHRGGRARVYAIQNQQGQWLRLGWAVGSSEWVPTEADASCTGQLSLARGWLLKRAHEDGLRIVTLKGWPTPTKTVERITAAQERLKGHRPPKSSTGHLRRPYRALQRLPRGLLEGL